MIEILILCLYVYLGDKANNFCRRNILRLETKYVYNVKDWLVNRAVWGFALGWITIPLAIIMWIFGARN